MYKRHKHDIIIIFAVLNLSIALFLAVSHYLGFAVPCSIAHGCETVLNSKYSMLFGLPLSVWGVVFYAGAIVAALLANHYRAWRKILTWYLALGAVMAICFLSLQFFVIKHICEYCLTSDTITILLFLWDLNLDYFNRPVKALDN